MAHRPLFKPVHAAVFAATACAIPAHAAVMEEIVVTAQKREQNVQDVGIAISALTGDQMRQLGYSNAQQVTAMAPGVSTVQPNGEANYSIAIRGVANSDFTTNVESPVAIYLDEVYISQMSGAGFMLFDMERVEILRGPQGTLYGRNATGGLAHFVTRKPTEEFEGYLQATAGDYDQIKLEGAVGGAFTEQLMARVSFATHDNDGYAENRLLDKKLNNANDEAYRAQILWTPMDSMEILLNARSGEQSIDTGFFEHVTSNITGQLTPNEVNIVTGYIDNDGDVFKGDYDRDGHNDLESKGYTGTIKWDFENFTLTSITDISTVKRDYIEDSDASPVPLFNFFLTTDAEQFSQELRLNGGNEQMNWVAGAYFLDLNIKDSNGAESEPFIDPASDTPDVSGLDNPYETNTESISIFGQVEWDFSDTLTGIAGLRWIQDKKDHSYATNAVDFIPGSRFRNGNPNILATLATYEGDRKDSEFAWRLGLNWQATDAALLYFSYNRGVKSGGYNSPIFPLSPPLDYVDEVMSYDPEQLDAYEAGFKTSWADGLLQLNGAAYYYDYQDYQAFQIIGIDTITTNAEGESFGTELELKASPVDGLEFMFGAAYNDIEVDLENGTPKTTSIQSPKWNLTGLVRYEIPVGPGRVALQYDIVHRSKHYFALTRLPTVTQKSYEVSNVSVGWLDNQDRWMVTGFVNNVSDEEYLVQTFDLSGPSVFGMTEQYYGRPRWYGVTVLFNF
jgi:iron complex outermembrane receptor protein